MGFRNSYQDVNEDKTDLMNKIGIEFVEEEFTQERRFFFIDNGNWDVEGICSNANAKQNHLNGRQGELE